MSHGSSGPVAGLPENARRPLNPGEKYIPVVPDETGVPEVTARSVAMGLVFCAIFSMAAAYLALKVGQGIEAAIPIAILAIGMGMFFKRRSSLLENVIVQSVGANSSHVVSGAVFTIPALYMLAADGTYGVTEPTVLQVILVSFLGGCLGILFLIPLRYHFMVEMHGQLPWPEGTATTEILLSGQRAGKQAWLLAISAAVGALYDGIVASLHGMSEMISFQAVGLKEVLHRQFMGLRILNNAAIVAIGYIVGIKYSAIICAGSFLSFFVLVPALHAVGQYAPDVLPPGRIPIGEMSEVELFKAYVRIIGVGGIAGAGIMNVLASVPSMVRSIVANMKALGSKAPKVTAQMARTDRSLSGSVTAVGLIIFVIACFLFFSFGIGMERGVLYAFVGTLLVTIIAFLFAPVSARAIAIVGTNPVSGMTMLTLIITGVTLKAMGLGGGQGMFVTMMVGGVVCTALAASGALASDLKIGHWLGATPSRQLALKFLGTAVAAIFCGLAMWVMSQADQGFGTPAIPAPQASAMKEILIGIFSASAPLQWYMFGLGVILSLILRMVGVPALAFALGMYLPMELNTPVLLGGILSWIVARKGASDSAETVKARGDRGTLLASGLVAGGAIIGVVDAIVNAVIKGSTGSLDAKSSVHILGDEAWEGVSGEVVAMVGLALLCTGFVIWARKAKAEEA